MEQETLKERIEEYIKKYTFQGKTILKYKNKEYTLYIDRYNSVGSYREFFNIINDDGYYIYIQNEINSEITGSYDIFYELNNEGSVNFISKYIDNDMDNNMNDDLLLELIGIISLIFKINKVLIHPYYKSLRKVNNKKEISGDNIYICDDILRYLEQGKKRFMKHINKGIENRLYYFQLDKLKETNVKSFVSIEDNNNLYYICKHNNIKTLLELYLYLVRERYEDIKEMEKQLNNKLFRGNNPFDNRNKYYVYYPYEFLYNYEYIKNMPIIKKEEYTIQYNFGESFEIPIIRTQRNQ